MSNSEWHTAVRSGSMSELSSLASKPEARARISQKDAYGQTPLHIACSNGDVEKVTFLLSHGCDVSAVDKNMWTPLHCAASAAHCALVSFLLSKGASATAKNNEQTTALHYLAKAAVDENEETMKAVNALLDAGTDVNAVNSRGETPLHNAAFKGRVNVARVLLERNAHINVRNRSGETPLHFASKAGKVRVVKMLIDRGADASIVGEYGNCRQLALSSNQPEVLPALAEPSKTVYLDVTVRDVHCIDLHNPKTFGSIDPYLLVRFEGREWRSEVVKKELNPRFSFRCHFQTEQPGEDLGSMRERLVSLEIIDDGEDTIGSASVDLYTIATGPVIQQLWLSKKGKQRGRIQCTIEAIARRRIQVTLKNVQAHNLRPAAACSTTPNWKDDVMLQCAVSDSGFQPVRTALCFNTFEPSWSDCASLWIYASLKELLSRKVRVQVLDCRTPVESEIETLGESEIALSRHMNMHPDAGVPFRENVLQRGNVVGALEGFLHYSFLPPFAQMENGVHTDEGCSDAIPLLLGLPLPQMARDPLQPVFRTAESASERAQLLGKAKLHAQVGELIDTLVTGKGPRALADLADLMHRDPTARDVFRLEGGVHLILPMLLSEAPGVQQHAARLLMNLLLDNPRNQEAVRLFSGVPEILSALSKATDPAVWRCLAVSISLVVGRDSANQTAVRDAGGLPQLVGLLTGESASDRSLVQIALGTLAKLCYGPSGAENAALIGGNGAMRFIVDLILQTTPGQTTEDALVRDSAVATLKALFERSAANQRALLPLLGSMMVPANDHLRLLALHILKETTRLLPAETGKFAEQVGLLRLLNTLSSDNMDVQSECLLVCKTVIGKNWEPAAALEGGATPFLDLLVKKPSGNSNATVLVLRILKKLVSRSPQLCVEICFKQGLPKLVALLSEPENRLQKRALATLSHIAANEQCHDSLTVVPLQTLIPLLSSDSLKLSRRSCIILRVLVKPLDRRREFLRSNGIEPLVRLLDRADALTLASALSLCETLADQVSDNRAAFAQANVTRALDGVMRKSADAETGPAAMRLLAMLCDQKAVADQLAAPSSPIMQTLRIALSAPYPNPALRDAGQRILEKLGFSTGVCTMVSSPDPVQQDFYWCLTCGIAQGGGVCQGCAAVCHRGHKLSEKYRSVVACSCGTHKLICQAQDFKKPVPAPLQVCSTVFASVPCNQRQFRCKKCWNDPTHFICGVCAERCHNGHPVEAVGSAVFKCQCGDRFYNPCQALQPAGAALPAGSPQQDKKPEENADEALCIICFENKKDALFYKCGHIATCMSCGKGQKICPICREPVLDVVKTFKI